MPTSKFLYTLLTFVSVLLFCSCNFKDKINFNETNDDKVTIRRFDRLESRYLTTGDFSALQLMSTEYPIETRTLIEDVLQVGKVTESDINSRFLQFFQDSILQELISDSELIYADLSDIDKKFNDVFNRMKKELPKVAIPDIYAQIGGLNQSIVVNNKTIGISIDKYLGSDYRIYKKYYSEIQREKMTKEYIVPDAVGFYLVSAFPMPGYNNRTQIEKDLFMGKIMWATNYLTGKKSYSTTYVRMVNNYMDKYKNINLSMLLENNDYDEIIRINRE